MKYALFLIVAIAGSIWSGGCGYVGQVKRATDMIEAMKPDVEKRNEELQGLADPTAAPANEPMPSP